MTCALFQQHSAGSRLSLYLAWVREVVPEMGRVRALGLLLAHVLAHSLTAVHSRSVCSEGSKFLGLKYTVTLQELAHSPEKYFPGFNEYHNLFKNAAGKGVFMRMQWKHASMGPETFQLQFDVTATGDCKRKPCKPYSCGFLWLQTCYRTTCCTESTCMSAHTLFIQVNFRKMTLDTAFSPQGSQPTKSCSDHLDTVSSTLNNLRSGMQQHWDAEHAHRSENGDIRLDDGTHISYELAPRHAQGSAIHGAVFACVHWQGHLWSPPAPCKRRSGTIPPNSHDVLGKYALVVEGNISSIVFDAHFDYTQYRCMAMGQTFTLKLLSRAGDAYEVSIWTYTEWAWCSVWSDIPRPCKRRYVRVIINVRGQQAQTTILVDMDMSKATYWVRVDADASVVEVGEGSVPGAGTIVTMRSPGTYGVPASYKFIPGRFCDFQIRVHASATICEQGLSDIVGEDWAAVRFSTNLLAAISWGHTQSFMRQVGEANTSVFDALLYYGFNLTSGAVDVKDGELHTTLSALQMETTCQAMQESRRPELLFEAQVDEISGKAIVAAERRQNGELRFFFELAPMEDLGLKNPLMQYPVLPMPPEMLNQVTSAVFNFLRPSVNMVLREGGIVIPESVAKYLPCDSGLCNGISQQRGSTGLSPTAGFVQMSISASRVAQESLSSLAASPLRKGAIAIGIDFVAWCGCGHVVGNDRLAMQLVAIVVCAAILGLSLACCSGTNSSAAKCRQERFVLGPLFLGSVLLFHSIIWYTSYPFEDFARRSLSRFGLPHGFDIEPVAVIFDSWWCVGFAATFIEAVLAPVLLAPSFELRVPHCIGCCCGRRLRQPDDSTHLATRILTCAGVLFTQMILIVGIPLTTEVGRQWASQPALSDPAKVGSVAKLLSQLTASAAPDRLAERSIDWGSTTVSASFTGIFVPFVGANFLLVMLAGPVGMHMGVAAFALRRWSTRNENAAMDMGVVLLIWMEVLASATVLGPFVSVYQMFGGDAWWWFFLCLTCLLRPCGLVPACRTVYRSHERDTVSCSIMSLAVVNTLVALGCGSTLWWYIDTALSAAVLSDGVGVPQRMLSLHGDFVLSTAMVVVVCLGWGIFLVLESQTQPKAYAKPLVENAVGKCTCCFVHCRLLSKVIHWLPVLAGWSDWAVWLLSMDALASFLYHALKCAVLSCWSGFFTHELETPSAVYRWVASVWQHESDLPAFVAREAAVTPVQDLSWTFAVVGFMFSCVMGWTLSLSFEASELEVELEVKDTGRRCRCCRRCKVIVARTLDMVRARRWRAPCCRKRKKAMQTAEVSLHSPLLMGNSVDNYRRLCGIDAIVSEADVAVSWAGLAGWKGNTAKAEAADQRGQVARRREYMWVGLAHWCLLLWRNLIDRDSRPHVWGVSRDVGLQKIALEDFHQKLAHDFHLALPQGNRTDLDDAFLNFDSLKSWCAMLQAVGIICLCVALSCDMRGAKATSRWFIVLAGITMTIGAFLPLLPDYVRLMGISDQLTGCAPGFDAAVTFSARGIFGTMFSSALGVEIFGLLFTLPVSMVRAVWLVLLRPDGDDQFRPETSENANSTDILHGLLLQFACTIPLVTIFQLLFCIQLTEDDWSIIFLLWFLMFPSMYLLTRHQHCHDFQFYVWWVIGYFTTFGLFLGRQVQLFNGDVVHLLLNTDWPGLWSLMHVDFCVMNVLITDLIFMMLEGTPWRSAHMSELSSTPLSVAGSAWSCVATREVTAVELQNLELTIRTVGARLIDGLGVLEFENMEAMQEAISEVGAARHTPLKLVPVRSFIELPASGSSSEASNDAWNSEVPARAGDAGSSGLNVSLAVPRR